MALSDNNTKVQTKSALSVDEYHQRTKHSLQQYAAGPGTLDWSMQPNPFRTFEDSPQVALPLNADKLKINFNELYSLKAHHICSLTFENIATLFELSLGLSAWKQYGPDKWSLRCNPSSGNLHPTEAYLVNWDKTLLSPAVYHYRSDQHTLEQRCVIDESTSQSLTKQNQQHSGFVIGLSSIHWREAWKYGERAYRYCQLDIGHAIGAISYAAACLGWQVKQLDSISDEEISTLLGLSRIEDIKNAEREHPDILLYISNNLANDEIIITSILKKLSDHLLERKWQGQANILDPHPIYHWPIIDDVTAATKKPETIKLRHNMDLNNAPALTASKTVIKASTLLRQRRSAQAFDNKESITQDIFYTMINKLLPRNVLPWNGISFQPRVHPVFYIHNVAGLKPGLYALPRHAEAKTLLKKNMRDNFSWKKVEGCPQHIPLYELVLANSQKAARTVSCHQDIAADSAFTISMLAEYKSAINEASWNYRYIHWEAGLIGQVLYLEAEAANLRATGIGCFFDDTVHEVMGINSDELQAVYHFTVGIPVIDARMVNLPPYEHLKR